MRLLRAGVTYLSRWLHGLAIHPCLACGRPVSDPGAACCSERCYAHAWTMIRSLR